MSTQGLASSPRALLQMELRPSRVLLVSIVLVHLLALFAVVLADIHGLLRLGIIAALLFGCYRSGRRQYPISSLQMGSGDIMLRVGERLIPVTLESAPWCNEWLQVLRFRPLEEASSIAGRTGAIRGWQAILLRTWRRRLNVVILPDSASAQSRRRLRLLLRWHGFAGGVPV